MVKLFKKQRTNLKVSFVFVLGVTFSGWLVTSCTNLADVVEGISAEPDDGAADNAGDTNGDGTNDDAPSPAEAVDLEVILTSLAENVILPVYQEFARAAVALEVASSNYAVAIANDSGDAADKLTALEIAWKSAMAAWQQAEMLQIGPAGSSSKMVAGANLRDEIYSWPTVNTCRVDQEMVEASYDSLNFFNNELVNVYGLDAIEYLVFQQGPENSCPGVVSLNSSGIWNGLADTDKKSGRANYSKALAANLVTRANELVNHWSAEEGNFIEDLAKAGMEGSVYETQLQALNDVFTAMFFLDTMVKDKKLATPAGLNDTCDGPCPEKAESQWGHVSKENIVANLKAFQRTFHGGLNPEADIGFDDLLVELEYDELAQTMTEDIAAAIVVVEAIDGSLKEALISDSESVQAAYAAVKVVTDNLKGDFVTVLGLTVPAEGAGDSD
jgi:predicted lipoprotein